jgi:two-component sensor histidine kinase
MNTDKLYSILNSDDLDIKTKYVIITNYFDQLCVQDKLLELVTDPRTDKLIVTEILERYTHDLYYASNINIKDAVVKIYANRERYSNEVVTEAILLMAAYDVTLIYDEIVTGAVPSDASDYFEVIVEYLISILNNNSSRLVRLIGICADATITTRTNSQLLMSMLFELIHVSSEEILKSTTKTTKQIVAQLSTANTITEIEKLISNIEGLFPEFGIVFYEYNQALDTLHCRYHYQVTFEGSESSVEKDQFKAFENAINCMSPLMLSFDGGTDDEILDVKVAFDIKDNDMLLIPCVDNGVVRCLICFIGNIQKLRSVMIDAMIVSKYLAKAISACVDDLLVLRYYNDFIQQHSFAVRSFTHEVSWALGEIKTSVSDVYESEALTHDGRERLDTCKNAWLVIDDAANVMRTYTDPTWSYKEINDVVSIVIRAMAVRIKENKVALNTILDKNPIRIYSGYGIITVITNILSNAIKAVQKNDISDRIITITTLRSGDTVVISIKDNGPGFPEQILHKVFQPGVSTGGSGLGLAIVKNLLRELGGEIDIITSTHGSDVKIVLPLGADNA